MRLYITILALLSAVSVLVAQQGSISGRVLEGTEALPFVNVYLKDTRVGTATDESGNFKMEGLAEGRYVLVVSVSW